MSSNPAPNWPKQPTSESPASRRVDKPRMEPGPATWADVMEDPDAYSVLIYLIRHRYNRRAICEVIRNYLLIKRILARETSSAETYDEHVDDRFRTQSGDRG